MKRCLRCLVGLVLVFLCAAVTVGNRPLHGQAVVATVPVGSQPIGVCVNPNNNRVYVSNHESNTVSVIDGATNQVIAMVPVGSQPDCVCVNPNNNHVYVTHADIGKVTVINGTTNQVIDKVLVERSHTSVGVSPNTNRVYVTNVLNLASGNVSVINGTTHQVIATVPVRTKPRGVCVNPNTNRVYVTYISKHDFRNEGWGTSGDKVSVIDGATNQVIATIKVGSQPKGVDVNPNTNRVYVTNQVNGNVSVINGATNQVIATVPVKSGPTGVGVNPNTNRVYVTNQISDKVSVIDGATNQVIAMIKVGSQPIGVCVNPNTNRVYVTNCKSNTVSVIDGAATNPVSKRRDEFIKKNGVEEWPDISELSANPFVYEGQTIAIRACFVTMQTATQGIFVVGDRAFFVVSDIPKGVFKEAGSIVVLAGRVLGKTELQLPSLGLMQVPHLKFVGVHFCQDNNCYDIIPEEASLEKATHASEDRKTHSKEPQKELTTKEALQQEQELENNNATAIEEAKKQQIPSLQEEGSNALKNQNWNAAVQAYKKLLEIAPENYDANTNIGTAYTMLNEFDLSIGHITKAQQLKPAEYQPYYLMGVAYARKGDKDRAIDSLRDAIYKGYRDLSVSDLEKDTNFPEDFKQDHRFKGLLGKLEINKLISDVKDVHLFDNHSQTFPYKYDNVWDALNYTLKDQDEKIIQSDKETGIVVTDTCRWAMNRKYYKYYILVERENDVSSKLNLKLLAHDSVWNKNLKKSFLEPMNKSHVNKKVKIFLESVKKRLE